LPPTHALCLLDLKLRGPHRWRCRVRSFLLNTTSPMVFHSLSDLDPPFSLRRVVNPVVLLPPPLRVERLLSWGCPKIAPPSRSPDESTPRSGLPCTEVQGFSGRSERSCLRTLVRPAHVPTSPFLRPRRFLPRQAAGVLHPAPIVGFGSFPDASALASTPFPAPRSCPPKPCSPMRATPTAHALVAAVRHREAVADLTFTEPLASSLLVVSHRNLEALLSHRSRTPVRRFQRRRAIAPLGLSIPPTALPRRKD